MKGALASVAFGVATMFFVRRYGHAPPLVIEYDDRFETLENVWSESELKQLQKYVEDFGTVP
jgi:hypothetical protein